ncbi:sigma-70 family RNA polymerase sigma factor [Ferrimonas balearica]|uniref:sigma-70 family RNA polymerase sigma factor n=1 Tax=Ferrimonas balearica TaxID=44012 RepID=UPI001C9A2B48|nr:sigma-70 family RNA polymerase sigma factor [Ferrimonas balearica]MBY5922102.1 sigma-70 family RNA polymerase sigma factor [Ferrimonas balearica]MBY5994558.1 sigma-70 family RNA polymerase sigma factor [Ferrimonas balearica]
MLNWLGKKKASDAVSRDMISKQRRYETLVRALHGDLYRYAYWLCQDAPVAEDLVQETFLRAWKALDSLKDDKAAKAWLITILRRENARRFERKQFDLTDIEQCQVADNNVLSHEQLADHQILRKQMALLNPEYREPLMLQVLYGFTGDEIAEILELNRNTVMTRLFRARNQLRDALSPSHASRGHSNG